MDLGLKLEAGESGKEELLPLRNSAADSEPARSDQLSSSWYGILYQLWPHSRTQQLP